MMLMRAGFGSVLHSEWTKFRSVRGWWVGMFVAVLVTVGIGLLGPAGSNVGCAHVNGQNCLHTTPPSGPEGDYVDDAFYFVHQPLTGDGSIIARVASMTSQLYSSDGSPPPSAGPQAWAKAGLIIKADINQGSAYAAVMRTGAHGVRMQYDFTHDTAGSPNAQWLKLTRSGDVVTGYDSADGVTWTEIGTADLTGLPSTVQIGMFTTTPGAEIITTGFGGSSGNDYGATLTGTFDHVSTPGANGNWVNDNIGNDAPGSQVAQATGAQQSGGTFTITGTGDIAPMVPAQGGREKTIEDGLVGIFAGLIAIVIVAVMFITGEYRRGLIRLTFAASPRRGQVLTAKALVAGSVTFVVGLVAAAVSIPVVRHLEITKGFTVYPVSALTELRVEVGAALLLAVTAVLALAIGVITRRAAGAVTAIIVAVVLPYILGVSSTIPAGLAEWLLRVTPAAAFAITQSNPVYPQVDASYIPNNGFFPLPPWGGFGVLCLYAALALAVAYRLLRRRDA